MFASSAASGGSQHAPVGVISHGGDCDDEEVEFAYRPMGSGGPSIESIQRSALDHFAVFKTKSNLSGADIKTLASQRVLASFATFLAEGATKADGKFISCGSALNYLSQVKVFLLAKSKSFELWKDAENG
jgi:hypothetical protein